MVQCSYLVILLSTPWVRYSQMTWMFITLWSSSWPWMSQQQVWFCKRLVEWALVVEMETEFCTRDREQSSWCGTHFLWKSKDIEILNPVPPTPSHYTLSSLNYFTIEMLVSATYQRPRLGTDQDVSLVFFVCVKILRTQRKPPIHPGDCKPSLIPEIKPQRHWWETKELNTEPTGQSVLPSSGWNIKHFHTFPTSTSGTLTLQRQWFASYKSSKGKHNL